MPFEHRVKVRYGETDQMGVVHHANHLLYLEEARTEYLASLGYPYPEVERSGIGLPVRGLEVRYRSPALYGDELVVELGVDSIRAASVRFTYRLSRADGGEAVADATVELACVSLTDRRPCLLPEELRRLLESVLESAGGGSQDRSQAG